MKDDRDSWIDRARINEQIGFKLHDECDALQAENKEMREALELSRATNAAIHQKLLIALDERDALKTENVELKEKLKKVTEAINNSLIELSNDNPQFIKTGDYYYRLPETRLDVAVPVLEEVLKMIIKVQNGEIQ